MATETIRVEAQGLTISTIIWRRYRRLKPGMFERTLDLNPGLAQAGVFLPVGYDLVMPVETKNVVADQGAIALWD